MIVQAKDLLGAWSLESWSLIYDDKRPSEFPLGRDAHGIILYTPDGRVGAMLMRTTAFAESFAYAGRYEVRDNTVFRSIEVSTNPALVGVTSTRHIRLEGNCLTLSGPDFSIGSGRTQQIVWLRSS